MPGTSTFALIPTPPSSSLSSESPLDAQIKEQFERCRQAGILRNDPLESDVQRKSLPGSLGLIAEYEPSLFAHKRAATISAAAKAINMEEPFDGTKFNFTKVGQDEVLVNIQDKEGTIHPILANVSPLMYGHGLLIPWVNQGLPQQLTANAVELALQLLLTAGKGCEFCVGFNSLGAFSSINHLHLHVLYPGELDHEARLGGEAPLMDGRTDFPIAYAPIKATITESYFGKQCQVDQLDWMVPCFAFQLKDHNTTQVSSLQAAVFRFVRFLHTNQIPHNVLFLRDGTPADGQLPIRVIVIPRKQQHCFDSSQHGFNAALGEISGMLIAKTQQHFDTFAEATILEAMKNHVSCEKEVMESILAELKGSAGDQVE